MISLWKWWYLNRNELNIIDKIIRKIKKDESFNISSQNLTHEQNQFLDELEQYIIDYCEKNNLKIHRSSLNNHHFDCWGNKEDLLVFYLNYNNFDYKYVIRKINNRLVFKIILRNNKEYRINIYNVNDFDHIVNCMYNDK